MSEVNILCIGDVVGKPGRKCLHQCLVQLIEEVSSDFTIVNIENSAHGKGVTTRIIDELSELPIDAFTLGNHSFSKKEVVKDFDSFQNIVRPLNFTAPFPGKGVQTYPLNGLKIVTLNALGEVFMNGSSNPFVAIEQCLSSIDEESIIIVDFHAEATSEKQAMGWFLDGKVSAIFGTHTHVLTYDHRVLPMGTGYITDIGMTGARDTIIGMEKEPIIQKFINQIPCKYSPPKTNDVALNGVIFTIDSSSKKTTRINPIRKEFTLI